jgi:hypothetical protein
MSSIAGVGRTDRTGGSENRYLAFIDSYCVICPRDGNSPIDTIRIFGLPLLEEFSHLMPGDERLRRSVIRFPGKNCSILAKFFRCGLLPASIQRKQ